jgi:26S proteasome regulatory subunit N7
MSRAAVLGSPVPEEVEVTEEPVPMDPLIELLHLRFAFSSDYSDSAERADAKQKIIAVVRKNNMAPYYELMKELIGSPLNSAEVNEMHKANEAKLESLNRQLADAEANAGDSEIREALVAKVDFFASIGDRDKCLELSRACTEKTIATGPKLDLIFQRIRLGLAFSDHELAAKSLQEARDMMKGGDWERRNRLKVYEGLYCVFVRDFTKGSKLLLDAITTFAATELLTFDQFIFVTVVSALVTLTRAQLKKTVVDSPEVLSSHLPKAVALVTNLYNCKYDRLFEDLAEVCHEMRRNVFLSAHVNFFFREVRVLAFHQFLDSYSSVTLSSMAGTFKIPVNVLDQMLYTLISNGRLSCRIDRVSGDVVTYRGNRVNFQYHQIIKDGDVLLNKIQKLSRVVEM